MATFIWRKRGRVAMALSMLMVMYVGVSTLRTTATSGGSPYDVPDLVDTNPDPNIVETTIVAEPAMVDIGNGVLASVLTFNGSVPGPALRFNVGDTVIVHFKNNIAHNTGIHWHGIELHNASDGTPLTQNQVPPGGEYLYKFTVTRPGVYWYHPHHHSSTNQVFKGLYGSLIVSDPNEPALAAAGVIPGPEDTRTMVLSDITVCKAVGNNDAATFDPALPHASGGPLPAQQAPFPVTLCETSPIDEDGNPRGVYAAGDVPNIQKVGPSGTVNEGQTVLTNGVNVGARGGDPSAPGPLSPGASLLDVQAGQGIRLQMINAATTRFFRLRLTDSTGTQIPLVRIGGQGGLLDNAVVEGGVVGGFDFKYSSGEILLDPGDRADVVAAIPPSATGVLTLWTLDFGRTGLTFAKIPTVPVAHFNVVGNAGSTYTISDGTPLRASIPGQEVETIGPATASLLDPSTFGKPGLASQDVRLTNNNGISPLGIDDHQGAHDFAGDYTAIPHELSARYAAEIGDSLELTVTNNTNAHHPFHLHGFSIQPVSLTKAASPTYTFPYREFRDNIDVPGGYTLRFRLRLDDRPLMDGATPGGGLGRWVFHCHIFFHATFGMISEFVVTDSDGKERPYVDANGTLIETITGQVIQMQGTYADTDGEDVTLSANVGAVADNGGGTWTWTYTTAGGEPPFVYITATDEGGRTSQTGFALEVNEPPVVTVSGAAGAEGSVIPIHATAVDPDGDPVTTSWTFTPGAGVDVGGTCSIAAPNALDTTIICNDNGPFVIKLTANDGINAPVSKTAILSVSNVAPTIAIGSPPSGSVYLVGSTVAVAASVLDPGSNDSLGCTFNWDGGGATSSAPATGGSCSKSNTFTSAGIYTTTVTVADDDGGSNVDSVSIVIYDRSAKLTGTGTIHSQPGALPSHPLASGIATFSITALYLPGGTSPLGLGLFKMLSPHFDFRSTTFDYLVVAGKKAQIRGSGIVIGGTGNYKFLLTAYDDRSVLDLLGHKTDKLRLKVWDAANGNAIVYDNSPGSPDDIDTANPKPIALGTIVALK